MPHNAIWPLHKCCATIFLLFLDSTTPNPNPPSGSREMLEEIQQLNTRLWNTPYMYYAIEKLENQAIDGRLDSFSLPAT